LNRRVSFDQFQTIALTIEFHSIGQLDSSQLFHTALFLLGMICVNRAATGVGATVAASKCTKLQQRWPQAVAGR
jgi:hypothetical protein